jgi:hypothetical protein
MGRVFADEFEDDSLKSMNLEYSFGRNAGKIYLCSGYIKNHNKR